MFDISALNKRYFEIKLTAVDDDGKEKSLKLEVEPPKIKVLKRLFSIVKKATEISKISKEKQKNNSDGSTEDIDQNVVNANIEIFNVLLEAVQKILSKNKSHTKVSTEYLEDLDLDQLIEIVNAYFDWLNKSKESNPN